MKRLYTILFFLVSTGVFAQSNVVPDIDEFNALKALWDNTNGASWTRKTGWPTAGHWPASATATQMDSWEGVTVSNGDISELNLNTNKLVGTVPSSIGNLTKLTLLRLDHNTLSGSIPSSINNLTSLTQLYLSYNSFSGSIADLGSLTALERLSIGTNPFTAGPFPSWLSNLTSLDALYMGECNRNGTIPDLFGNDLGTLTTLTIYGNSLTGSIPVSLTQLSNLQSLDVSSNQLSGSIPDEIGNMTALRTLSLQLNKLSGAVPATVNNLHYLTNLSLFNNKLTALPSNLDGLTSLQQLNVNSNLLAGSLPEFASTLSTLQILNLYENKFTGTIPASYADLPGLTRLAINTNQLSGSIPQELGSRTTLNYLILHNNKITGTIPSSLGSLVNLTNLYLSGNQLEGPIPSTFSSLTKIVNFSVQNNQLNGQVPAIFSSMPQLSVLYLYGNHFTGTLPQLRGNQIDVSSNSFTGEFPAIGSTAVSVIASNNGFSSINSAISSASLLVKLDLANNELRSLPASLLSHPAKAALQLLVGNNRLDFSTLETFTGFNSASVVVPQKNIKDEITHAMTVSGSLTLTARNAGAATTITWEKQSGADEWSQVGSGVTYTKTPVTKSDEGTYRWKSTSTAFSATTIQSDPIVVKTAQEFTLDNWAFQYRYDGRKRITQKKVPGADWVYMIYDDRDRLVMTQDGEQRKSKKWMITQYDVLNRPAVTGIYTHDSDASQRQMDSVYNKTAFTLPPSGLDVLTKTFYDNYDFIAGDEYFSYKKSRLNKQDTSAFNRVKGMVTGTWTSVLGKDKQWLRTVNYYDDKGRIIQTISDNHKRGQDVTTSVYDFVGKITDTKTESIDHRISWTNSNNPYAWISEDRVVSKGGSSITAYAYSTATLGANVNGWVEFTCSDTSAVSSTRTFGFSSTTSSPTVVAYGAKQVTDSTNTVYVMEGATVKSSTPVIGGDIIRIERKLQTLYYSKNGVVFYSQTPGTSIAPLTFYAHATLFQQNSELFNPKISVDGSIKSVRRHFEYDHAGRLLETWHSIDNAPLVLLSKQEYNELGQLIDKKIHSTDTTNFRQSIDYRYNIRGWLTSMNGADLDVNNSKNIDGDHERKDLFGMDLLYNEINSGLDNAQMYNGNISAMRWSNNLGLGPVKERGYNFDYDAMNRLNSAVQKTYTGASWAASSAFHESGVTYDLNGNIETLSRTDATGTIMDQLSYDYGADEAQSNMLMKVSDEGTKEGFSDAPGNDNDYSYDRNGNLVTDNNKSITSITYNHLNLPEIVKKSTNEYLTYTYDATGRKLSQDVYTNTGILKKRSDYRGEWFYENDTLRFVNHEEGRAVAEGDWVQAPQMVADPEMTSAGNYSAISGTNVSITTVSQNSQSYLKVVSTQAAGSPGFTSNLITVVPGRTYTLRVKGYTQSGIAALYVLGNGYSSGTLLYAAAVSPQGAVIPQGASNEAWVESTFTVPVAVSKVKVGVGWRSGVAVGSELYVNTMELYENNGIHGNSVFAQSGYTYQYHLKDHLGNVRMTFTTKDEKEESIANLETTTSDFLYYDEAVKINSEIFDHTDTLSTHYSARLNGTPNERYGLAKSLSVMPGDTINMQVFAKYLNPDSTTWTTPLGDFMTSLLNGTAPPNTFIDGGLAGSTGGLLIPFWALLSMPPEEDNEDAPKAYMNWLVFDRDYNLKEGGAIQISTAAEEHGQDGDHEELYKQLPIKEAGYVYVYLSNDNLALNEEMVEVYFDDFKVEHVKSPVVSSQDYYPFGLSYNGYSKENSLRQSYLYQEKEWQQDLSVNLYDFEWRQYDPLIGRTTSMDPHATNYIGLSPYSWVANNPLSLIDPDGQDYTQADVAVSLNGAAAQDYLRELQAKDAERKAIRRNPPTLSFNAATRARREEMAKEQQTQGNDPSRSKDPYDGHSVSLGGSLAFGGGINAAIGIVWNKEGDWRFFVSGGPSAGFDASVGVSIKSITNKNTTKPFDPNQYGGWGSSHNIGAYFFDIVPLGGDNYPSISTGTMGASYYESGGGVSIGSPVGYTYQMSNTLFPGNWFK